MRKRCQNAVVEAVTGVVLRDLMGLHRRLMTNPWSRRDRKIVVILNRRRATIRPITEPDTGRWEFAHITEVTQRGGPLVRPFLLCDDSLWYQVTRQTIIFRESDLKIGTDTLAAAEHAVSDGSQSRF